MVKGCESAKPGTRTRYSPVRTKSEKSAILTFSPECSHWLLALSLPEYTGVLVPSGIRLKRSASVLGTTAIFEAVGAKPIWLTLIDADASTDGVEGDVAEALSTLWQAVSKAALTTIASNPRLGLSMLCTSIVSHNSVSRTPYLSPHLSMGQQHLANWAQVL